MLQQTFCDLVSRYSPDFNLQQQLWREIEKAYTRSSRHYHTLAHLEIMLQHLIHCRDQVNNWDVLLFSLYYHDIVYNVLKHNNEEKSAELAGKRLTSVGVPVELIRHCTDQVLATKSHTMSSDTDTNLFTDADLCILGQSPAQYAAYTLQVRKEYHIYPDLVFIPARKKVLHYFLDMGNIYKTDFFYQLFEAQARVNLAHELSLL